jgi:glycosyltransferase 2 family protein
MSLRRQDLARLLVGVFISAVFLAVTLSRVDLGRAAAAIADASPSWLAAAVLIVVADLAVRARRWQALLHGVDGAPERTPYRLALGYLSIGYLANAALPARLGDVARAVLAGTAFHMPRLTVFGTIMVERISDGLTMLGLAILSSLAVAGIAEPGALTIYGLAVAAGGAVVALVGWHLVSRSALAGTRIATAMVRIVRRISAGGGALRHAPSATTFVALTAAGTSTALLVAWAVSQAVGVQLGPLQIVLFVSTIALSLAIPAAPGSLGTYEFVGVTILTSLGYSPEQGLATILLMRLVATIPPALAGLVSAWVLHIRPRAIVEPAEATTGMVQAE